MNCIRISDITMKQPGLSLSFKEKLELSKLLDKLGVSVIALEPVENVKIDSLLIKSIASAVKESAISVPVELNNESVIIISLCNWGYDSFICYILTICFSSFFINCFI